jgi:hypothetical protein
MDKDKKFGSDEQLEKHAREHHGLSLAQFRLMCEEADKRFEGQFACSTDKHLAVESFYEGFKVAVKKSLHDEFKIEDSDFNKHSKQKLFEYIIFLRIALDNELQTKWIDVNELLPRVNSEVMTWGTGTANNSFGYMQAWYSEKGWQELDSCGDFFNDAPPTHWIPLSSYKQPNR